MTNFINRLVATLATLFSFLLIIVVWSAIAINQKGPLNNEIKQVVKEIYVNEKSALKNFKDLTLLLVKDAITKDSDQPLEKLGNDDPIMLDEIPLPKANVVLESEESPVADHDNMTLGEKEEVSPDEINIMGETFAEEPKEKKLQDEITRDDSGVSSEEVFSDLLEELA